ncbi:MAG: hypothetical protein ACXAC2_25080, partial [Candidatus Kariarchaeaceae archaeon]
MINSIGRTDIDPSIAKDSFVVSILIFLLGWTILAWDFIPRFLVSRRQVLKIKQDNFLENRIKLKHQTRLQQKERKGDPINFQRFRPHAFKLDLRDDRTKIRRFGSDNAYYIKLIYWLLLLISSPFALVVNGLIVPFAELYSLDYLKDWFNANVILINSVVISMILLFIVRTPNYLYQQLPEEDQTPHLKKIYLFVLSFLILFIATFGSPIALLWFVLAGLIYLFLSLPMVLIGIIPTGLFAIGLYIVSMFLVLFGIASIIKSYNGYYQEYTLASYGGSYRNIFLDHK